MVGVRSVLPLAFALTACGAPREHNSVNPIVLSELGEFRSCEKDDDCVFVNNGCCDCANSGFSNKNDIRIKPGQEISVNRAKLPEFKALFDCFQIACTERARTPMCGDGRVYCWDGLCQFEVRNTKPE